MQFTFYRHKVLQSGPVRPSAILRVTTRFTGYTASHGLSQIFDILWTGP